MDSLLSTPTSHCTSTLFTTKPHSSSACATTVSFSLQSPPQPPDPNIRRSKSTKPKTPPNPLKNLSATTTAAKTPPHVSP
ncbi:MAP kinase kinase kinase SskB [Corchorus capsularis]|uniref:MAP kinase kinase kinase SskB n=1 Tax=Corchorus capsularis TaxID=210143 RepID=A0A1R3JN90_COCAP|nr:MAP kinase kinase kinase SskB [Corchorus capsularis]